MLFAKATFVDARHKWVNCISLDFADGPVITTTIHTPHLQLVGVTMMYTCPIDGVPEPTFTWYKNRTKIPTDARTSFPGRAIKIVNFAKEDRDEYTCMGENNIEPFNASYTVEIIAQCKYLNFVSNHKFQ